MIHERMTNSNVIPQVSLTHNTLKSQIKGLDNKSKTFRIPTAQPRAKLILFTFWA